MKITLIPITTLAILSTTCGSPNSNDSQKDTVTVKMETEMAQTNNNESEWISLFDGESLEGWTNYNKNSVGPAWKVEKGVLYLDASNKENWQSNGGGDIVTDETFEDFHFKIDWKISQNGNSGIIFLVQESEEFDFPWNTGLEYQILDNDGHPDGKIKSHRAGDLYDLIESSEEAANPVGEWNHTEIILKDGKLDFYLNGVNTVSTNLWDESWKNLIDNSKFKDMKGFGQYQKGKIALQDHGNTVWFKNIKIKRL
ncbi:DUF1080 domain-containing protein [Echinicola jeungdonensis]|uniref:DUF1080 domain-containing protein n=1 Tax=Echinicola jeungdonensis TaxID=709343 RepID=A0ABV5J3F3_9BACT|nr:DUF1080 domain-containing protein [Echinicola jeungdonensis]MDN3669617.1 DUF1080 domain-containing protein [Echinicola jeungdonensis]